MNRQCDVLIVTALPDELQPIRKALSASSVPSTDDHGVYRYDRATIGIRGAASIAVILGTARAKGSARMSAFLSRALATWQPRYVILAGIAAGVPEAKIGIGCVLVSTDVVDVTELKVRPTGHRVTGRRKGYPCDEDLVQPLGAFADTFSAAPPKFGQMLCQPNVVKSAELRRWLISAIRNFSDETPVGIEMEGAGVVAAVRAEPQERRPSFVVVKGTVDLANFHKADSARERTTVKVAEFLGRFLSEGWLPSIRRPMDVPYSGELRPPSASANLFGRSKEASDLLAELRNTNGSPAVSIEGLGGIGKTALAEHVKDAALAAGLFDRFARFTVQNGDERVDTALSTEVLVSSLAAQLGYTEINAMTASHAATALREALERQRALVIIDNIERPADLRAVCDVFSPLRAPCLTRILLTSRPAIGTFWPAARTLAMHELDTASSIAVLAAGVSSRTFTPAEVPHEHFIQIYESVGGNPQALLVAAGLFGLYPVEVILRMLRRGEGAADALYRHVYWPAWIALEQPARNLLIAMRDLPEEGVDWRRMSAVSGLEEKILIIVLGDLLDRHLVATTAVSNTTLYSTHRLTRTFVEGVVESWEPEVRDRAIQAARRRNVLHTLQQVAQGNDESGQ